MNLGKLDWASLALYFGGMSGITGVPGFSNAVGAILFHPAWGPPGGRWIGAAIFLAGLYCSKVANIRRPAGSVVTDASAVPAGTTQLTSNTPRIPLLKSPVVTLAEKGP